MRLGSQQARNPKTGVPGNQWLTVDVNSLNMFKPWLCGEGICTSCDLCSLAQLRCIVLLKVLMGLFTENKFEVILLYEIITMFKKMG